MNSEEVAQTTHEKIFTTKVYFNQELPKADCKKISQDIEL